MHGFSPEHLSRLSITSRSRAAGCVLSPSPSFAIVQHVLIQHFDAWAHSVWHMMYGIWPTGTRLGFALWATPGTTPCPPTAHRPLAVSTRMYQAAESSANDKTNRSLPTTKQPLTANSSSVHHCYRELHVEPRCKDRELCKI